MKKTWLEVSVDEKSLDEKVKNVIEARENLRRAVSELEIANRDCLTVTMKSEEK